jgi:serine/threonine protein kinase/tetratricopeptide (TPR) repeat protein
MQLSPGARLGRYEIVAPLGAGGMGEVWKARDTRLDRFVAIKQLTEQHSKRFEQEARAIAALNHPHICQIYDVGSDYLVLEYVEGKPLRGPLPIDEVRRLALQIAAALEEAHRQGILHRDLKPANVLITSCDNHGTSALPTAKLLDFGLAKVLTTDADVTRTTEGSVVGTAAYMSPEQAMGKPVDARSDIFSFGALLYEMLSGERAFAGDTAAQVLSAVLRDEPDPLPQPSSIERTVRRCLSKKPADRFQTMHDVKASLEEETTKSIELQPSIAVLPFANMSGDKDQEYFSDGLAEEIISALTHIPGLKVTARTSAFAFRGKEQDITKIAEALRVSTVLEGSVRRAGSRIRVSAQLINARDGYHLWSERYDRELADVFAIQDEIARAIAAALQLKLVGRPPDQQHVPALAAYDALLRGRYHLFKLSPETWPRAKQCFEQAIDLDPAYSEAHAYLGLGYFFMGMNGILPLREVASLVREEAQQALELKPSDVGPRLLLGGIAAAYDYDWQAAAEHFGAALAANPVAPNARWAYASFCTNPFGRFEESVANMQREVERDPLNVLWRSIFANHLHHAGMQARAISELQAVLDLDANFWLAYYNLAEIYIVIGRFAEAVVAGEKAYQLAPWNSMATGIFAAALVRVGQRDRAEALIAQMGEQPIPVWGRIGYHLLCSEIDAAADWYEKAIRDRDPFAVVFARIPYGKALRDSTRWPKLARMMNL